MRSASNGFRRKPKRLLVAKDSFAHPLVAWLATVFERIDVVDLRFYDQMTLAEASMAFESDVVAVVYNPMAVVCPSHDKMWHFCGGGGDWYAKGVSDAR